MDRRSFLKAAGSFALLLPWAGRKAFAQGHKPYPGPFLLCIHAGGGWDTTLFFNPKAPYKGVPINRAYPEVKEKADIPSLGPFHYAPTSFRINPADENSVFLHSPLRFLEEYRHRLLLLNGVDTETNAHPVGEQRVWSGHAATQYPSLAALLAIKASRDFGMPCAYFANSGGYTRTLGLVPLTQVNDAQAMRNIANQERFPVAGATTNLFSEQTHNRIQQANEKRVRQLGEQLRMPASKEALGRYSEAMLARNGLEPLVDSLPTGANRITLEALRPGAGGALNGVLQQTEMALHGFSSSTMASASITLGGFDTHSNNDNLQRISLGYLFVLIEYVLRKAEALGLLNLYVVVGSDFARTPAYNTNNFGKDHWNTTSYMLFGPDIQGGRVLGATADDQSPGYVNPLNPAELLPKDAGGMVPKPSHVHHALRRVLGLSEFNAAFGLMDEDIRLF